MKTYNFVVMEGEHRDTEEQKKRTFRDTRNGIICIEPTMDMECYMNYIDLLNLHRDKWVNYGYLDLGMMPLAMAPSFMQGAIREGMATIANGLNVPIYYMPAVSLLFERCSVGEDDIWVFKSDIARVMNIPETQVTLNKFLRWCMQR